MLAIRSRQLQSEQGTNLVEFAFVVGVFLLIIFGIVDLGRVAFQYNLLASSAREGARLAIIQSNSNTVVTDRVVASSVNLIAPGDVTISGTRTCSSLPCGTVTVAVQSTFSPVTPLISGIVGNTLTLNASSTMVVER